MKIKKPANWKTADEVRKTYKQVDKELLIKELGSIMNKILKSAAINKDSIEINVTSYGLPFVDELQEFLTMEGGYRVGFKIQNNWDRIMIISW